MTLDVPLLRSDDAVTSHLAREAAIGGYEAAAEAADRIADVYRATASSPRRPSTCRTTSRSCR